MRSTVMTYAAILASVCIGASQPITPPPVAHTTFSDNEGNVWRPTQGQFVYVSYDSPSINMEGIGKGSGTVYRAYRINSVGYWVNSDADNTMIARTDGYIAGKPGFTDTLIVPTSLVRTVTLLGTQKPPPITTKDKPPPSDGGD